jgi:hypothetical protein
MGKDLRIHLVMHVVSHHLVVVKDPDLAMFVRHVPSAVSPI